MTAPRSPDDGCSIDGRDRVSGVYRWIRTWILHAIQTRRKKGGAELSGTYDVLARILRDNETEVAQLIRGGRGGDPYVDGLQAAGARVRAAMAGLSRGPLYTELAGETERHGRTIDADVSDAETRFPRISGLS